MVSGPKNWFAYVTYHCTDALPCTSPELEPLVVSLGCTVYWPSRALIAFAVGDKMLSLMSSTDLCLRQWVGDLFMWTKDDTSPYPQNPASCDAEPGAGLGGVARSLVRACQLPQRPAPFTEETRPPRYTSILVTELPSGAH